MTDEMTPKWAVELLVRFEQLDAKITTAEERNNSHANWAERNIKDLEIRMRAFEAANLLTVNERVAAIERKVFMYAGSVAAVGIVLEIIRWNVKG